MQETNSWAIVANNYADANATDNKEKTFNCTFLINPSNRTYIFDEGWLTVPETVVFNLVLFFFFLIIFILLRRLAWDRRHVNIRRTSKGWLQSIYGDRKLASKQLMNGEKDPIIHHKHDLQIDILLPPNSGDAHDNNNKNGSGNYHQHNISRGGYNQNNTILESINDDDRDQVNVPLTVTSTDRIVTPIRTNPPASNQNNQQRAGDPLNIRNDPENTLGASFDFANISNNVQATFVEVGYKLSDVLLITNDDILNRRGNDALQYVLFQQYIIYFMAILMTFCMLVILPVNLQGKEYDTSQGFARTTVLNLPVGSDLYWVHVIGASLISLIGIFMMHRFSKVIQVDEEQITRRTLLIRRVPKNQRNKELLANYFKKAIPNCVIEGIQSIYDVRKLAQLTNELTNLVNARCYCIEHLQLKNERLQIRPSAFGEFGCLCGCCESCKKVDGIQFYTAKEEELQKSITLEMAQSVSHPTGGYFITFQTEKMAQEAFVYLRRKQERAFSICPFSNTLAQLATWFKKCLRVPQQDDLEVTRWMISYAPYPDDMNWCDLTVNLRMQWFISIAVSLFLLLIFVFISTPLVILGESDIIKSKILPNLVGWLQYILPSNIESKVPGILSPLILAIAASVLPSIVTQTCQCIAYVNMTAKNHAIMWKVYLYLLFMVIIWPSLNMTSLKAFVLMMMSKDIFPWNCLFPVNIGAFFVNYTIQSAFLGNIMELMRLPELLIYAYYMAIGRSRAEVDTASRYVVWDFSIGIRYPRFLLVFALVVTYSVSFPLITVAGLVYISIKHLIDRYNIYYVYTPSKINSKIHSTAIMFVHIAFLMMQAQIFVVTFVRTGGYSGVFMVALIVLLVSLLVFSGHFFFYIFRNINHLTYRATRKVTKTRREYCACAYLPPVLYDLTRYTDLKKSSSGTSAVATALSAAASNNSAGGGNGQNNNMNSNNCGVNCGTLSGNGSEATGTTCANGIDSAGSSQILLVPTIDTSDAYFLSGSSRLSGNTRPKFGHHTTLLSTRKHVPKSRRTASDGQQQFHPSRLVQYEELPLKRTNSDLDNPV